MKRIFNCIIWLMVIALIFLISYLLFMDRGNTKVNSAAFPLLLPLLAVFAIGKRKTNLKTTDDQKNKIPIDKRIKEKVKQKKAAENIKFLGFRIKKKFIYFKFQTNQDLQVDSLNIDFLDKDKKVIDSLKKEKFSVRANTPFLLSFEIKLQKLKLIKTKYFRATIITGGGVKTTIIKRVKILSLA